MANADVLILVVDDEPQIRCALLSGLKAQGYRVQIAADGDEALRQFAAHAPDLIILDLMLPGDLSGLDVCQQVRAASEVPIIVLSARTQEAQKVAALDFGADDYLTKPFGMDELSARIRAALRRRQNTPEPEAIFTSRDLIVDYGRRLAFKAGQELKLTPLEYEILRYLTPERRSGYYPPPDIGRRVGAGKCGRNTIPARPYRPPAAENGR